MISADRQWLWMAAAAYAAGLVVGLRSVWLGKPHSKGGIYTVIAVGYLMQCIGLFLRGRAVRGCPLGNTFEVFQFTAWSATTLYILIGATFRMSMLGFFTSCLAAVMTLVSLLIPSWDLVRNTALIPGNPWVAMHAALAMFSYGIFGMLALTSLLYFIRQYSLRYKRLGGWFSFFPPLADLEVMSLRLHLAGVGMLSIALAVGCVHWRAQGVEVSEGKLLAVLLVWAAYSLALVLRWRGILVARRYALACTLLFLAAMLSLWPVDRSRHPLGPSSPHRVLAP